MPIVFLSQNGLKMTDFWFIQATLADFSGKLVKFYRLDWTDTRYDHGGKEKDHCHNYKDKDVQQSDNFPVPAYRHKVHIIVVRIKLNNLEAILKETDTQAKQVAKQQTFDNEVDTAVNEYRPDETIGSANGL